MAKTPLVKDETDVTKTDTEKKPTGARTAAIVIAAAFGLWMVGSWAGGMLGLPVRFAFLLDMACMAALVWSLVVLYRVWRAGQEDV